MDMVLKTAKNYVGLVMLVSGILATGTIAQFQITSNSKEIVELKKSRDSQIRMEERQKVIQKDVEEIKYTLREVRGKL